MNTWNLKLFALIAGGHQPDSGLLRVASLLAEGSTWLCAALILVAVFMQPAVRSHIALVLVVAAFASMVSRELASAIGAPRPFMLGLSPEHISHGARAGLPSTHASVMFTVAFMLTADLRLRTIGLAVLSMAIATGWARIYIGVHFPADVAAGAVLGACIAGAAQAAIQGANRLRTRADPQLAWLTQRLAGPGLGLWLLGGFAMAAVGLGLNMPLTIGPGFVLEGGTVENGTLVLYVVAAMLVLRMRPPAWSWRDAGALCIVLLALAAHDANLHVAMFDMDLLQARFPGVGASPQIALAIAVSGTVAAAAIWLTRRLWMVWRSALLRRRWRPAARTVAAFGVALLTAGSLDQLQAMLADGNSLRHLPATLRYLMLSMEEVLELALPVLAVLGLLQLQMGRYPTWFRRNADGSHRGSPRLA
ncbi:phosphatase PAP2 family protein [Variovorax ginsengisoli]|uniref:Membrane-associated phospholipid phosphatase n=1 Tax=Variovorax ginsengisoli TaxID=363844 RepID=A0ABT9S129_9BURK|nr:phosphatase PAP2 family protein [Variovorax ginsengisoli]MDP9898058.1 membrane-associated phospholipid phosphatase [Variovorax ginsengisoli]